MERFTRHQPAEPSTPPPAAAPQPAEAPAQTAARIVTGGHRPTIASKLLVLSIMVASIAVTTSLAISTIGSFRTTSLVKADQYQAVFLDNGQVYFGRLSSVNADYIRLIDIYYLQVEQQIQPERRSEEATPQQKISLAKLGNELHGPEDEMFILRDKVVFWENLKAEGQVSKAIAQYVETGGNSANEASNEQSNQTQTPSTIEGQGENGQ